MCDEGAGQVSPELSRRKQEVDVDAEVVRVAVAASRARELEVREANTLRRGRR
jgi:hypothetical protein